MTEQPTRCQQRHQRLGSPLERCTKPAGHEGGHYYLALSPDPDEPQIDQSTVHVYCDASHARWDLAEQWQNEPARRIRFRHCGLDYQASDDRWAKITAQLLAGGIAEISLTNLARYA